MVSKINISKSKLELSELALGMWRVHTLSAQELDRLLNTALENGITTFDHADIYGSYTCETAFGKWMKANPGKRSQIQLVSKCGIKLISESRPQHRIKQYDTSRKHIISSVENSLMQLNSDYLDLLLIHRPDPLMNVDEIAETFNELKRSGKVNFFGVSNFTPSQFDVLNYTFDNSLITNQIEMSLFQNNPMFDGTLDHLQLNNITSMAWSPLGGMNNIQSALESELLKSIASIYDVNVGDLLLMWLLKHPSSIIPVLGTMNPERVKSASKSYKKDIHREDWFQMLKFARGVDVA